MPSAKLYQITARFRARQFMPTDLSDFTTDAGIPVDAALLSDPLWSLYSLDLTGGLAVFVRLAPDTDLSRHAFIPQAQFDAAEAVATVALDDLPALSKGLPRPDTTIFLFSIGRCGTTLANHILNTAPDTCALSEPRAFVTLAMARRTLDPARAQALIAAVTRFMYRQTQARHLAIKLHSQALYQADLFHAAFPQARFIFMYRDARGWANSFSMFLQNLGHPLLLDPEKVRAIWRIMTADAPVEDLAATLDPDAAQTAHPPLLAAGWAHNQRQYRQLVTGGVPFFPLSYTALNSDREASIRALLSHCGLADSTLAQALATFDRDSQEGTVIGRGGTAQRFTEADTDYLHATLTQMSEPAEPRL